VEDFGERQEGDRGSSSEPEGRKFGDLPFLGWWGL
jgi:hypothetical protein